MHDCWLFLCILSLFEFITSDIIWFLVFSSSLSGVICLLKEKLILWSSLSNLISPLSSLLTLMVLSFFLSLKLQGLHLHFIPLGFISISFLSCNFPLHKGQSKEINLLDTLCSSFRLTVVGSSSLSSKSSGIGFFSILFFLLGGIYFNLEIS